MNQFTGDEALKSDAHMGLAKLGWGAPGKD